MFSFGIFTTHLPYVAMVAFYAYFLLFGVDQTSKGEIEISDNSVQVQIHLNNPTDFIQVDLNRFLSAYSEKTAINAFEKSKVKQKWKRLCVDKIFSQDYLANSLFGRPPPVLA